MKVPLSLGIRLVSFSFHSSSELVRLITQKRLLTSDIFDL